jgi:predicted acylesterase/phospholipase RssA
MHADGGIMNNFPVEPLSDMALPGIIGSYVCSSTATDQKNLSTSLKVMFRAFDLSQEALSLHKFDHCDYVVAPKELHKIGFLDSKGIEEAYEIGYKATIQALDDIIDTLALDPEIRPRVSMPQPVICAAEARNENILNSDSEVEKAAEKSRSHSSFSYFDIWPLSWAFGKQEEQKASVVDD